MPILRFNPDSDTPLQAAAVVALIDESGRGRVLKEDRAVRVAAVWHEGREFVVKRYAMNWVKASLYDAVRLTPAWREWHGARRLARAGVRAVQPAAMAHHGWGKWKQSLVMPYVQGVSLVHFLADATVSGERRLAVLRRVGEQAAAMVRAGIVNRDHKAANLLVDAEAAAGTRPPWVLDAAGLRRATPKRVRRMTELLVRSAGTLRGLTPEEERVLRSGFQ